MWQLLGLSTIVLMSCVFLSCGGGNIPQVSGAGASAGTFQIAVNGDSGNQHISTLVTLTIK